MIDVINIVIHTGHCMDWRTFGTGLAAFLASKGLNPFSGASLDALSYEEHFGIGLVLQKDIKLMTWDQIAEYHYGEGVRATGALSNAYDAVRTDMYEDGFWYVHNALGGIIVVYVEVFCGQL